MLVSSVDNMNILDFFFYIKYWMVHFYFVPKSSNHLANYVTNILLNSLSVWFRSLLWFTLVRIEHISKTAEEKALIYISCSTAAHNLLLMERNLMNYCSKKDIWFQRSKEYKCATLEDSYVRYDFFL